MDKRTYLENSLERATEDLKENIINLDKCKYNIWMSKKIIRLFNKELLKCPAVKEKEKENNSTVK